LTASCSGGGSATSYLWTLPDGAMVATTVPQLSATAIGSYTVQGVNGSGTSAASPPATVAGAAPTSCAISPSSVTLPSGSASPSTTLTAACSGGGAPTSYLWTLPGGAQVSTTVSQLVATAAGAYAVQAFSGSASSPVSTPATVFPPAPTACSISPAIVALPPSGSPVALTASCTGGTAVSYLWTLPDGMQVTTVVPQLLAAKSGRYAVQGKSGEVISPPSAAAVVASSEQVQQAARQLTTPQATAALTIPTVQIDNIRQHLDQLRFRRLAPVAEALRVSIDGRALPPLASFALAPVEKGALGPAEKGGGAAADSADAFSRWGAFVSGDVNIGRQAAVDDQTGFKLTSRGLTLGGDYRFPGEHVLGAALGFAKSDGRLDDGLGTQDIKGYSVSVFGSLVPADKAYIDLIVNFARTSFDSQRQQQAGGSASSDTDGTSIAAALSAGWNLSRGALTANPYGRIEYVDARIDGFTETGDAAEALTVGEQRIKATTLTLGGQLSYAVSTSWGVLLPYAKLELQYLAQTSAQDVTAQLAAASSPAILVPALGDDRTFGNFAVGASAILPRGVSGFFTYEQLFGKDDFRNQKYTLGLRVEF
jgi:outer membrane autotransporter protein